MLPLVTPEEIVAETADRFVQTIRRCLAGERDQTRAAVAGD